MRHFMRIFSLFKCTWRWWDCVF